MAALGSHFAPRQPRLAARLGLALGLLLLVGCARGRLYQATSMPAEFMVGPRDNVQTVDLSRLEASCVSSELIDRGDVLEVTVETGYGTDKPTTSPVRVTDEGVAIVPLIGKVGLAGLELQGAEQAITAAAVERGVYRNPSVTVVMKQQRTNRIMVVGGVEKPAVYELPRGASTLAASIVKAGGLSKKAGSIVEIRRPARGATAGRNAAGGPALGGAPAEGNQQASFAQQSPGRTAFSRRVNLVEAARQGNGNFELQDGDVVNVEVRDAQPVHVMGLVNKPGEIELPANQDLHVLDAISRANGLSTTWADKVHVIRHMPDQEAPVVIEVSLAEAKREGKGNLRLGAGDVVSIEQTPTTVFMDTLKSFAHFTLGASVPIFQ